MLLGPNFCMKLALLLFTSPGMTINAGPGFEALAYSTGLYRPLSAISLAFCDVLLPCVGEGLSKVGWATAGPASEPRRRPRIQSGLFMSVPVYLLPALRQ